MSASVPSALLFWRFYVCVLYTIKTITTGRHSRRAPNNRRNMHKYVIAEWLCFGVHVTCMRFQNNNSNFFYVVNRRVELNLICAQPAAHLYFSPMQMRTASSHTHSHTQTTNRGQVHIIVSSS